MKTDEKVLNEEEKKQFIMDFWKKEVKKDFAKKRICKIAIAITTISCLYLLTHIVFLFSIINLVALLALAIASIVLRQKLESIKFGIMTLKISQEMSGFTEEEFFDGTITIKENKFI